MFLTSVRCPITGQTFKCVHCNKPVEVNYLDAWSKDIADRMNRGENVTIAFDCEGINLGCRPNSGVCIQVAEIFGNGYVIGSGPCPEINIRPGFIVFFPFTTKRVRTALNRVFNGKNISIVTFDFTNDIAALMEGGIAVNTRGIIDCQTIDSNGVSSQLKHTLVRGLKSTIDKICGNIDPVMPRVRQLGGKEKKNWDAIAFLVDYDNCDKLSFFTQNLLEYSVADLTLTALACVDAIKNGKIQRILQNTRAKVKEYNKLVVNQSPLRASMTRQFAFFDRYDKESYCDIESIRTRDDIINALRVWINAKIFIFAEEQLGMRTSISLQTNKARYEKTSQLLKRYITEIRALARS